MIHVYLNYILQICSLFECCRLDNDHNLRQFSCMSSLQSESSSSDELSNKVFNGNFLWPELVASRGNVGCRLEEETSLKLIQEGAPCVPDSINAIFMSLK